MPPDQRVDIQVLYETAGEIVFIAKHPLDG